MKKFTVIIFLFAISHSMGGQDKGNVSDVLETTLAGVVTVALYQTEEYKRPLSRGESPIAKEAYKKVLSLENHQGSGSGFIINQGGTFYAVTNYHVIEDASDLEGSIKVFSISRKPYEVKVVGGDPFYDIAVLKFVDKPGAEIIPLKFKNAEPRIGEKVYAIGNPLGEFPYSVSDGIISAKNRVRGGLTGKFGYLQTTATIIWGNSGGPLVDQNGQVTGINTFIEFAQSPDGGTVWASQINFALEAKLAQRLFNEIITNGGRVERSYLGVEFAKKIAWMEDGSENSEVQKLNEAPVISGILPGSPAALKLAGKEGRQVKAVNNEEIRNMEELLGALEMTKAGQDIILTLAVDSIKTEKITLRSVALRQKELESIALFFFKKDPALKVIENRESLSIQFNYPRLRLVTETSVSVPEIGYDTNWVVAAAGRKTLQGETMYKVTSMRDVGAALKLSSLSGSLDFYMAPEGTDDVSVRLFSMAFSDEAYKISVVLYY